MLHKKKSAAFRHMNETLTLLLLSYGHLCGIKFESFNNDAQSWSVYWLLSKHNITHVQCADCAT